MELSIPSNARKQGGSVIMTIPPKICELAGIHAGDDILWEYDGRRCSFKKQKED